MVIEWIDRGVCDWDWKFFSYLARLVGGGGEGGYELVDQLNVCLYFFIFCGILNKFTSRNHYIQPINPELLL